MHKTQKNIKVGIIGATGYTGVELIRLLTAHPHVEITCATSETYVGKAIEAVYPHLRNTSLTLQALDLTTITQTCDLVFIALPHGHAIQIAETLISNNIKIIDLGADFRLKDKEAYANYYQTAPAKDSLLANSLYGLPEINEKSSYDGISLVANPGCYPTAAILGAAPLLANAFISPHPIILDGKSGVSGAGRSLALGTHYCEVAENFKAYSVAGTHRHTPEIEQAFAGLTGDLKPINFTPHLVPMVRGLFMTGYYTLKEGISEEVIREKYHHFYKDAPFVRILPSNQLPETAQVRGSNYCDIGININKSTQTIVITSVIDNLIKGASGQAIQNMNLLCGFNEMTGLTAAAIYP